ncbi:MAG: carbohydrate ABC transporter permease [Verrucomicrobia bacterium]|nr:carbohydrate ABC transporter permease [Verrucomicrobiota bacterium]
MTRCQHPHAINAILPLPRRIVRLTASPLRKLLLWGFAIWCLFPIYWLFLTSLKKPVDVAARPPKFFFQPDVQNYIDVFYDPNVWSYFRASTIVALGSTAVVLAIGIPTAYVLARYKFRGNADFGFWILTTRMTPPVAVLIPFFVMYVNTGLLDTHLGLIIAHVAMNLSIVVWLMKGFFEDLPPEFEEAAFMDGASHFQAFYQICLPVAVPGIAAAGILAFMFSWNEFLFSLVLADSGVRTVPVGLYGFVGYQQIQWGSLSAAAMLMLLPVLAFVALFQRQLIRGLTMGAIK